MSHAAGDEVEGNAKWRTHWQPTLLAALCGAPLDTDASATAAAEAATRQCPPYEDTDAAAQLRANVSVYALPAALKLDPGSLPVLLRALLQRQPPQVRL